MCLFTQFLGLRFHGVILGMFSYNWFGSSIVLSLIEPKLSTEIVVIEGVVA